MSNNIYALECSNIRALEFIPTWDEVFEYINNSTLNDQ